MEKGASAVKPGLHEPGRSATLAAMDMRSTREERLAEALRANLRRRKAQARWGDDAPATAPPPSAEREPEGR